MTSQHPPGHQYQAAPGWYADPSGAAWLRYFDGYWWTDHVHPAAEIHQPQAAVVRVAGRRNNGEAIGGPALDDEQEPPLAGGGCKRHARKAERGSQARRGSKKQAPVDHPHLRKNSGLTSSSASP